jgi:hypothetical protein
MATVHERQRLSGRSAVTNGTRLFLSSAGIDYRSLAARRFRDLIHSYEADFEVVTEADQSLVRTAAMLTIKGEQMQAALVRGENVESDEIVRNAGQLRRILGDLRRKSEAAQTASPSLLEHLAAANEAPHDDEGDD